MENLFISIDNFIPKPIGFTVYRLDLRMGFNVVHKPRRNGDQPTAVRCAESVWISACRIVESFGVGWIADANLFKR